jgi:alpha-1,6-mannosyltransferase
MKFCDITIAYNASSGGVRTYIDEKRRYLLNHTEHEHLLIIPGEEDKVERQGRLTTIWIDSPLLPGQDNYRFFVWPRSIRQALLDHQPEIIELSSYYVEPWAAFAYRDALQKQGRTCVIGCYFHTDVAEAYVGAPLRSVAHEWFDDWSTSLTEIGTNLAHLAEARVERYIGGVFGLCDLSFASSPAQAARLRDYGVPDPQIVPLGVDLDLFGPSQRCDETRALYGAGPNSLVLIYAGRLSSEKHVLLLVEALQNLPASLKAVLWMVGHGPLHDDVQAMSEHIEALQVLPYENDRVRFASMLASADIYVTAWPHETFALSVIEAQASGLPVVGVDAGALRERVLPGLGYLGPVGDAPAMADNIVRAAADRSVLGAQARHHVEQNFGWGSTFTKLLACYDAEWQKRTQALLSEDARSEGHVTEKSGPGIGEAATLSAG